MKRKHPAIGMTMTGALFAAALALPAAASEEGIFTKDFLRSLQSMKMMAMMDGNKDHLVSREEFMAHQSRMFDMMDRNKDGMLDATEWQARLGGIGGKGTN